MSQVRLSAALTWDYSLSLRVRGLGLKLEGLWLRFRDAPSDGSLRVQGSQLKTRWPRDTLGGPGEHKWNGEGQYLQTLNPKTLTLEIRARARGGFASLSPWCSVCSIASLKNPKDRVNTW